MTVARLRVEMTSQEFTDWIAFDEYEASLVASPATLSTTSDHELE